MNIVNFRRWALAAVAGLSLGVSSAAAQTGPPPIHTKNAALRLPVQLDERSRLEVAEIKLYVRGPSGRWECVQTAPATQTVFDYRAPADGEYRFTFVTVDRRGKSSPANVEIVAPHRMVVVDTTAPDVTAQAIPIRGERFLQCQVQDAHPDWSSLRVAYLAPDNSWRPLVAAAVDTPTVFRVPSPTVLEGKVQVTAADRAGNRTTKVIDLAGPTAAADSPAKAAVEKGKPDPSMFLNDDMALPTLPPPPDLSSIRGAGFTDAKAPAVKPPENPGIPDVPAVKPPDLPPAVKMPEMPPVKTPDDIKIPDLPPLTAPEVPGVKPPIDVPPPPAMPAKTSALKPTDPTEVNVPDVPRFAERAPEAMPASVSHPMLATRTCSINYQLEGPGRGATKIDFWATPDGGKTWVPLRDESAGTPPARLTLPADGVFGIRIRPGAGSKPPEPGEEPDCVVEVDTTKPVVNLSEPVIGSGDDEGTMLITWTATDKYLQTNSINLHYATSAEGPWQVIVTGYKNAGTYKWAMPTGLTGAVYLRLEASDKAGNVGRCDLTTPVALETGKARVKVIGVGPAK